MKLGPRLRTAMRAALWLLVFQVCFELVMRVYLFGFDSLNPVVMHSIRHIGSAAMLRPSELPGVRYDLLPDLDTLHKKVPFRTNSVGLRDREYPVSKPSGVFRVAVIGDSFTVPSGVAIDDAFHSILEERLSRGPSGTPHEFINFAVGGWGPSEYVSVLEHRALAYAPDLVLIGFCPFNDFIPLPKDVLEKPFEPRPPGLSPFLQVHSWPTVWRMLQTGAKAGPDLPGVKLLPKQRAYLEESFARLADLAHGVGVPLVVANLSFVPSPRETVELLDALAREHGFHVLHLERFFDPERQDEYAIYRHDGHPNAAAHAIFADALYDFLVEEKLVRP